MSLSPPSLEVCFLVLYRLYALSGGKSDVAVRFWPCDNGGELSWADTHAAVGRLQDLHLLKLESSVGAASVTALGAAAVQRALMSPEQSSDFFPALSQFFALGEDQTIGLCASTVQVWLDQLDDCAQALAETPSDHDQLDSRLGLLEQILERSNMDPQSLKLGLLKLRAAL